MLFHDVHHAFPNALGTGPLVDLRLHVTCLALGVQYADMRMNQHGHNFVAAITLSGKVATPAAVTNTTGADSVTAHSHHAHHRCSGYSHCTTSPPTLAMLLPPPPPHAITAATIANSTPSQPPKIPSNFFKRIASMASRTFVTFRYNP